MPDKHQMITGAECSLFNSSHEYREGYNFYHCTCGEWETTARPREVSNLFLAHVIQNQNQPDTKESVSADKRRVAKSSR